MASLLSIGKAVNFRRVGTHAFYTIFGRRGIVEKSRILAKLRYNCWPHFVWHAMFWFC
uniref:Uncharacterized protein n=1 Tax=Oryza brachyantha TaxID=4533 RepID=J3MFP0_ORYBR